LICSDGGTIACQGATINAADNVNCVGDHACNGATMTANQVACDGSDACSVTTISAQCLVCGENGCDYAGCTFNDGLCECDDACVAACVASEPSLTDCPDPLSHGDWVLVAHMANSGSMFNADIDFAPSAMVNEGAIGENHTLVCHDDPDWEADFPLWNRLTFSS
jgi:hypothetical protein